MVCVCVCVCAGDAAVRQLALQPYPMVTTVDIYKLQLLFNNPTPFIDAAIKAGLANGYAGYNLGTHRNAGGLAYACVMFMATTFQISSLASMFLTAPTPMRLPTRGSWTPSLRHCTSMVWS